jgi:hypothetical protein
VKTKKDNVYLPSSSRAEIGNQSSGNYNASGDHAGSKKAEARTYTEPGAPLDPSVSNNTTVVNDGRPSGEGGRMHLLGSHNTETGSNTKYAQDVSGKEQQRYQHGSEFDGSRRDDGQGGNQHGTGNPLLDRTMDDGTPIKHAYLNPVFYREQPMLWLPRDQLGLSAEQVSKARSHGIDITDEDATIDQKAKIEIQRDTLPGQDFDP